MHYTRIPHQIIERLLLELASVHYTFTDFVLSVLTTQQPLITNAYTNAVAKIHLWLDVISTVPTIREEVRSWVHKAAKTIYSEDVCNLTHPSHGFRFNAANASLDQIEDFSLTNLETVMKTHSPQLYDLVSELLVSDPSLDDRRTEWSEPMDKIKITKGCHRMLHSMNN